MAQHISQSKGYRDLNLIQIANLTESQAREQFTLYRWGSLTVMPCPHCGAIDQHYPRRHRKQWRCKHCDSVFSVTTGTPFSNRKLPFKKLLLMIYEFISAPKGCSANALHSRLGMTCRTAHHNLSKLREAIFQQADLSPLKGHVQIDGGHFCGKPRRPRKRKKADSVVVNNHLKNRKASMVPNQPTTESWNIEKLKNRRIVLVLRQMSQVKKGGAERTIAIVVQAENSRNVLPVIRRLVAPDSVVGTDDGHAYSSLSAWYEHSAVRHSVEYSTVDGVNNNQAESYFGRFRRAEYGTYHGMRPQYLAFYANEMAWREDMRKSSLFTKFHNLMGKVFQPGVSKAWCGYFQGHRLGFEYIG